MDTAMVTTIMREGAVHTTQPGEGSDSGNEGTDDYFRPISCYTGSLTSKISGDVNLEETLVTCPYEKDVCFGKVVLTVSNDTEKSDGYIQVALLILHHL